MKGNPNGVVAIVNDLRLKLRSLSAAKPPPESEIGK